MLTGGMHTFVQTVHAPGREMKEDKTYKIIIKQRSYKIQLLHCYSRAANRRPTMGDVALSNPCGLDK